MIRVVTPPAVEPITLAQAKLHCRVDHDFEDAFITSLIIAARMYCEGVQNRAYVTQSLAITLDNFPSTPYELPMPPLQGNVDITYLDEDGVSDTVDTDDYVVDIRSFKGRIMLKRGITWPDVILQEIGAVSIFFDAGYPITPGSVVTGEAVGTGDDTEDTFQLQEIPITAGSETIYLNAVTVIATDYTLDYTTGELVFGTAPAAGVAITADYTQEDDLVANVPQTVKQAMLLLIGHWYKNREGVITGSVSKEIEFAVNALLSLDRVWPI